MRGEYAEPPPGFCFRETGQCVKGAFKVGIALHPARQFVYCIHVFLFFINKDNDIFFQKSICWFFGYRYFLYLCTAKVMKRTSIAS